MKSFDYVINDKLGIHARPAGLLVKLVSKFSSTIELSLGDKKADPKRLFALMGLGVKQGDKVTISANGADEDVAISEIEAFFKENL